MIVFEGSTQTQMDVQMTQVFFIQINFIDYVSASTLEMDVQMTSKLFIVNPLTMDGKSLVTQLCNRVIAVIYVASCIMNNFT